MSMTSLASFARDVAHFAGTFFVSAALADYKHHALAAEREAENLRQHIANLTAERDRYYAHCQALVAVMTAREVDEAFYALEADKIRRDCAEFGGES